jgi:hypothetical protein
MSLISFLEPGLVLCRVYLNRQTAYAHLHIFKTLDSIVYKDTNRRLQFRHIHAPRLDDYSGCILQWTADQHGGQAKGLFLFLLKCDRGRALLLGLGLYLQGLSKEYPRRHDLHQTHRLLTDLSPYEHLHRIYRLCTVHIKRNIRKRAVPEPVRNLMRSLVCVEHPKWDGTLDQIQQEGGKPGVGENALR